MSKAASRAVEKVLISEQRSMNHILIVGVAIAIASCPSWPWNVNANGHDPKEWQANLYHFVQQVFR